MFEFVRLEAMYDRIFATTNSHCPLTDTITATNVSGEGHEADTRGSNDTPRWTSL